MREETIGSDSICLTFSMESSASLWNIIFEGFDQEVVLVSKFAGKDPDAVKFLYKFALILEGKYKNCSVEPTTYGIKIKKSLPQNDFSLIRKWTGLMENIRDEMSRCVRDS